MKLMIIIKKIKKKKLICKDFKTMLSDDNMKELSDAGYFIRRNPNCDIFAPKQICKEELVESGMTITNKYF